MTIDLERQVRDYVSHVVELSTPVDIDARTLDMPVEARRLPRRRPLEARWGAGLAAAVVLLALIGGLAIGYQLLVSDELPVITQPTPSTSLPAPTTALPSPSTTIPSPSTTLAEVVSAPLMSWQQVPSQASLGAGDADHEYLMHAVVSGGPGLIAGGQVRPTGDIYYYALPTIGAEAAVWTSKDGITWDRVSTEESGLGGPGGYAIHDLTVGGPGYIAVGVAREGGYVKPAVWLSEDGLAWTRVESASFEDGDSMQAVSASDDGIVAVGGTRMGVFGLSSKSAIWYSVDGTDWERALASSGAWFSDVDHADWGFVAVGGKQEPTSELNGQLVEAFRPYALISQDGQTWEGVNLPEQDDGWFGAQASAVVARGDEVVVAGNYRNTFGVYFDMPPTFWRSTDGVNWIDDDIEAAPVAGMTKPSAWIAGLAVTDSGTVAVGGWHHVAKAQGDVPKTRAAVWVSSGSGMTWAEVPPGSTFEIETMDPVIGTTLGMDDVVVLNGVPVGVGIHAGEAAVWIGDWMD